MLMKDETLTGHDAELVHKLYRLATDWDYRDARGTEPAMPTVSAIQAIGSLEDVTAYLYNRENPFRFLPLGAAVGTDLADPTEFLRHFESFTDSHCLLTVDQSEFLIPQGWNI